MLNYRETRENSFLIRPELAARINLSRHEVTLLAGRKAVPGDHFEVSATDSRELQSSRDGSMRKKVDWSGGSGLDPDANGSERKPGSVNCCACRNRLSL